MASSKRADAAPPAALISATIFSALSIRRSQITTCAPFAAIARALAAPIPLPPPATTAI